MVIHMLRKKLGDAVFFQGLKSYLNDPALAFGFAKTEDMIRVMESTSGVDLTEFFNDWIYGEGYPSYIVRWNQVNSGSINITLSQTQSVNSVSFFEANVPLRLFGTQGETLDILLDNTVNNQAFWPAVPFTVQAVQFDPERDIISGNNQVLLGMGDLAFDPQIVLYPNPSSKIVNIDKPVALKVEEIRIYNSLGQLLSESNFEETIDISKYPQGILFLQLQTEKGIVNKTIVRE